MVSKISWIFPGQGSQSLGMGKEFLDQNPKYITFFEQAEKITNMPLRQYIWEEAEMLKRTDVVQPAIYTLSCAMAQRLLDQGFQPESLAGHSLGEYAALFTAWFITFEEGLRLLSARSKFMQEACEKISSGMLAVISDQKTAESVATEASCQIANFNSNEQFILSGLKENISKAQSICSAKQIRSVPLQVAGAYHSSHMKNAAESFASFLDSFHLSFNQIKFKVFSNLKAEIIPAKLSDLKNNMIKQIDNPVLWQKTVENMIEHGTESFLEIGPGNVLTKMLQKQKIICQIYS